MIVFLGIVAVMAVLSALHYRLLYRKEKRIKKNTNSKRSALYLNITSEWIINKQLGKSMEVFFKKNNIQKVAVYGMGTMEELLSGELRESGAAISYYIDKKAANYTFMYDVITPDKIPEREAVDAIIVTPVFAMESITNDLKKRTDTKIISLEELVFSME